MPGLPTQPPHLGLCLLPADAHRGMSCGLNEAGVVPVQASHSRPVGRLMDVAPGRIRLARRLDKLPIFLTRNWEFTDREIVVDSNPVLRVLLVGVAAGLGNG